MSNQILKILKSDAPTAVLFVRIAIGAIFLSEGIQKFLCPAARGVGRFAAIGIPYPEFAANFVGVVEIVCGLLVIIGLVTRLAALLPANDEANQTFFATARPGAMVDRAGVPHGVEFPVRGTFYCNVGTRLPA